MVAKKSSLTEYPAKIADGRSHVDALSTVLAEFGKGVRKAINDANELNDMDTADLFTEISAVPTNGCGLSKLICRPRA